MDNIVNYVLNLKDNMSAPLSGATQQAKAMETQLVAVKSMAMTIGSVLGVSFAVFKGIGFVKEGVEKFHELEKVTAKIEANLRSTGEVAGMGMKELQGFAKELSSKIQASRTEVMDMQSQMLTFPAITKENFQQSMGLIADIAKQTGHGLSETAIMYGKALNSPMDGLAKMMRYGVMFTDAEKQKITKLQESGHLIEAQKAMMEAIAKSGYAGVAEAMFNADPLAKFNKTMGSLKMIVGEVAVDFLNVLTPALMVIAQSFKWVFTKAKEFIDFLKDNKNAIKNIAIVIGAVGVALGIMAIKANLASIAYWGLGVALKGYAIAQNIANIAAFIFSAALWANPVFLVAAGVAALAAGVVYLSEKFGGFGNAIKAVWDIMKAFAKAAVRIWAGVNIAIVGALSFNPKLIKKGISEVVNAAKDGAKEISTIWNNDADAKKAAEEARKKSLMPAKKVDEKPKTVAGGATISTPKTKAEGQKNINIKISYNAPLIKDFTISTTNIKQGLSSLKEEVSAILTSATHDALIVADY